MCILWKDFHLHSKYSVEAHARTHSANQRMSVIKKLDAFGKVKVSDWLAESVEMTAVIASTNNKVHHENERYVAERGEGVWERKKQ